MVPVVMGLVVKCRRRFISRFVVDVSFLTFRQIVELRTRPYERGAATPCIPCQRGLFTVEFHEGRLAELARTARPPTRLGCVTLAGRKRTTRQTAVPGLCSPAQLPRLRRA